MKVQKANLTVLSTSVFCNSAT